MERTRNGKAKLNRLRATRHPVSALRKEAAGPLSRDPEGRPHDLAPCTLEPWAELQRGRDGALAGRPPGPGAAPHAARHILVFSGLDRPVILERRLVSRQNGALSHRFLDPCEHALAGAAAREHARRGHSMASKPGKAWSKPPESFPHPSHTLLLFAKAAFPSGPVDWRVLTSLQCPLKLLLFYLFFRSILRRFPLF